MFQEKNMSSTIISQVQFVGQNRIFRHQQFRVSSVGKNREPIIGTCTEGGVFPPVRVFFTPLCPECAQGTKPGFGEFPPAPYQKKNFPKLPAIIKDFPQFRKQSAKILAKISRLNFSSTLQTSGKFTGNLRKFQMMRKVRRKLKMFTLERCKGVSTFLDPYYKK